MNIHWPVFLALVLVSYISPGPDTVVILRSSAGGMRTGLLAAAGALCGLTVHLLISAVGLSAALVAALPQFVDASSDWPVTVLLLIFAGGLVTETLLG